MLPDALSLVSFRNYKTAVTFPRACTCVRTRSRLRSPALAVLVVLRTVYTKYNTLTNKTLSQYINVSYILKLIYSINTLISKLLNVLTSLIQYIDQLSNCRYSSRVLTSLNPSKISLNSSVATKLQLGGFYEF